MYRVRRSNQVHRNVVYERYYVKDTRIPHPAIQIVLYAIRAGALEYVRAKTAGSWCKLPGNSHHKHILLKVLLRLNKS